jgi:ubiquinol-cytochrome c reductase cytochrome b subunit
MKPILSWFETRLDLRRSLGPLLMHPIPKAVDGPMGWWYVFGSASMTLLFIQILTGIGLAMVYVPAADKAYESLVYLNYEAPLGWFLRSLHYWSGSAMVVMVVVHMTQVFLHGAFKFPRELNWVTGVFLFLLTLGMAFTGQVLRWDADAYWGIGVGASMAGRVPWLGPYMVNLLLGGSIISAESLSRFFALHVFVLPASLLALLAVHLWLVVRQGISEPPVPGKTVDPKVYTKEYQEEMHATGVPFFGDALLKDMFFSALTALVVVMIAALAGPKGPGALPVPALLGANPKPDWPFLWLFALLSLSPPAWETVIILVLPIVLVGALLLVPFVSNSGERAPSRRPVAVLSVVILFTLFFVLTSLGSSGPWSPVMQAWSSDTVPEEIIKLSSPLQLQGAIVFQNKQCRNCHALNGLGGRRGPELNGVGTRLTRDQLIAQVSNGTPGGGNMPAYGKQISPAELNALVAFLVDLRPGGRKPAEPAAASGP